MPRIFFFSAMLSYARHRIILTLFSLVLLLFLTGTGLAQDIIWSRTYGGSEGDWAFDVGETSDGGYIMVGHTESFGLELQVYLVKTDAKGDKLWTRTYGGNDQEKGVSVRQTSDGGYIVVGHTSSYGHALQAYLIKTGPDGLLLWFKTYGGRDWDGASSVQQTTDGGYILAGWTYSYGGGGADLYLIKTDAEGMEQWSRTYGGIWDERGYCVEQTSDGGYIITGSTESFYAESAGPRFSAVYLIKTNSLGDTLWSRHYYPGGGRFNSGYSCQQTTDGGYIVAEDWVSTEYPAPLKSI